MTSFLPLFANIPIFWPKVEFALFLIGQILSIPCYLFAFYHLLLKKTARQTIQNHSILILLLYNFFTVTIDIAFIQHVTRTGYAPFFSPIICLIWQFIDFGLWYGAISLMLWVSIERHILIFHPNAMQTNCHRMLFHYIPLLITALYAPTLFFVLIFLIPCDRVYVPNDFLCGSPCFYNVVPNWFNYYDSFVDYAIPIVSIGICNICLFLRFLKQKQRLRQSVTWRQCRKMLIQLFLVSAVYLVFDLPYVIIFTARFAGFTTFGDDILSPYIMRLTMVPSIIIPYPTLLGLPGLTQKLNALLVWKRNYRRVEPTRT